MAKKRVYETQFYVDWHHYILFVENSYELIFYLANSEIDMWGHPEPPTGNGHGITKPLRVFRKVADIVEQYLWTYRPPYLSFYTDEKKADVYMRMYRRYAGNLPYELYRDGEVRGLLTLIRVPVSAPRADQPAELPRFQSSIHSSFSSMS